MRTDGGPDAGAKAKRSVIERELRYWLACVRVSADGVTSPDPDSVCGRVAVCGRINIPRDTSLPIRVQCLRLAVQALTGQESQDTTLPGAITRIHQDATLEIRA